MDTLKEEFRNIKDANESWRERRVKRYIIAVKNIIHEKYGDCWEKAPWVVQFLPLIVKHFWHLHLLNAVNPGMDGFSGLTGVSKKSINDRLNDNFRPDNLFFKKVSTTTQVLKAFEEKYKRTLPYPLICKPDIGERATGVTFIYCDEQLQVYLKTARPNFILEAFCDTKREFGLSWIQDPESEEYTIVSLVEKQIPFVVGNGKQALISLVENKCASMKVAPEKTEKILSGFSEQEQKSIPYKGAEITIVRTASISYGTKFKKISIPKASRKKLSDLIGKMIAEKDGVFVGRFDLRSDSVEDLLQGKVKIIELNGIGGMPLEIYEPHLSISKKYEILFAYFEDVLAFAKKNIEYGRGMPANRLSLHKHVYKILFGKEKTQELPADLKEDLKHILKLVLGRGRI
jgi:hypothetical protein